MTVSYKARDVVPALREALDHLPVVVLTGMRQTGKTTFLQRAPEVRDRRYVTFDDFAQLEAARRDPEALLAGEEPLTIDEAQKCPELLRAVKREVDRRRRPGRFLLSGSANFALLRGVAESLAGRALYLPLHPFNRREILGRVSQAPFLTSLLDGPPGRGGIRLPASVPGGSVTPDEILRGGMPSVCLEPSLKPAPWFRGFEQTYLERDLRDLAQVADLVGFRRLMKLAALRTAQVLNRSGLARDARLNAVTASRYLDLLETSYVIAQLPAFLSNRGSRLVKSPKLFVSDSGLAAHLAGVDRIDPLADEPLRGALFETYLFQNLSSILSAHRPESRLHYWLVHGRHEVDFVVETGRDTIALEAKAATRWGDRDLASLRKFLEATPRCRAAVLVHNGTDAVSLGDRLWAIPAGLLIS